MDIRKKSETISLQELREKLKDDEFIREKILKTFRSIDRNSIEDFLHNKAIDFEKKSLSATHIIYNKEGTEILGYFTFANKSLIIEKENFLNLSRTQQKRFSQSGRKLKDESYVVNSFLLAQIGKNYNISDKNMITGNEIISLAHELLLIVKKIINTKYLWLECEDNSSLIRFYSNYGFNLIKKFSSENNLKTMILRLDNF